MNRLNDYRTLQEALYDSRFIEYCADFCAHFLNAPRKAVSVVFERGHLAYEHDWRIALHVGDLVRYQYLSVNDMHRLRYGMFDGMREILESLCIGLQKFMWTPPVKPKSEDMLQKIQSMPVPDLAYVPEMKEELKLEPEPEPEPDKYDHIPLEPYND